MDQAEINVRRSRNGWVLGFVAIVCLIAGAAGGIWWIQRPSPNAAPSSKSIPSPPRYSPSLPVTPAPKETVLTIPPDALARMNLGFADVGVAAAQVEIRTPGIVQPDGYKQVAVTPVTGGIATEVAVELGQSVKPGQKMAQLFSRELAEAQAALAGVVAERELEHKKLTRAQELVRLGAASREELEGVEAAHSVHMAHVDEARQRLLFLGLTPEQVDAVAAGGQVSSYVVIPAPIDGVVIARQLNPGQVVSAGQELFTVTDLSSVWVEGNLLENDFSAVRVGSRAVITTPAYPGRTYQGAVEYIDPRVTPETRTARVRVALPNRDMALRLGMYVDILFSSASGSRVPVVSSKAIQQIGTATVVFVPLKGEPNRFEQRSVTLGGETSAGRQVVAGLLPGDKVVTDGSFLLRAESVRLRP